MNAELPDDDREYALAVVANQHGCKHEEAEAKLAELGPQAASELVACGRAGLVAECRKILGLE